MGEVAGREDPVELELGTFVVRDVVFGRRTALDGTTLIVCREELEEMLQADPAFTAARVELARPGERVRIIHALDVVEPRTKVGGSGTVFPGFLGPPRTCGWGRTHRLEGMAVVETSPLAWEEDGISVKEAIIDMAGPAVPYSPFSRTLNVVLTFELTPGLDHRAYDGAIRMAGLRAAAYLAEATRDRSPARVDTLRLDPAPGLPRIVHVDTLMTEGAIHKTFVYGEVVGGLPTLMHPNELRDGAIVCGNHHIACERNPTYFQQANPVVEALHQRHGRELDFRGVIIAKTQHVSLAEKERVASYTAALAKNLGAQGAIITHDTAGHAALNLMLTCQRCEELGIATVVMANELCGADGGDWGLVYVVPEARAMVSTGNKDELIELPPVERVIGGDRLIDWQGYEDQVSVPPTEAFRTPLRRIYGAAMQVGAGCLTARET